MLRVLNSAIAAGQLTLALNSVTVREVRTGAKRAASVFFMVAAPFPDKVSVPVPVVESAFGRLGLVAEISKLHSELKIQEVQRLQH